MLLFLFYREKKEAHYPWRGNGLKILEEIIKRRRKTCLITTTKAKKVASFLRAPPENYTLGGRRGAEPPSFPKFCCILHLQWVSSGLFFISLYHTYTKAHSPRRVTGVRIPEILTNMVMRCTPLILWILLLTHARGTKCSFYCFIEKKRKLITHEGGMG